MSDNGPCEFEIHRAPFAAGFKDSILALQSRVWKR